MLTVRTADCLPVLFADRAGTVAGVAHAGEITLYTDDDFGGRSVVVSGDTKKVPNMVRFIDAPVNMVGTGWVGSAAVNVFLSVPKERRYCLTNTRFLIHQPSGGAGGQASDIAIQAREIVKVRERIAGLIARESGQTLEKVTADIDRDYWMSIDEAKTYGILGSVVSKIDARPRLRRPDRRRP